MKKLVLLALAITSLHLAPVPLRADDADEVRKAFDLFVQYAKVEDDRMLDLFAPDIAATFYYEAGQGIREMTLSADELRQMVKANFAKKSENKDQYEDIQCKPEGDTVKLTCTLINGKTSEHAPLIMVYAKDGSGAFKIKAMRLKIPPPKVSPGS